VDSELNTWKRKSTISSYVLLDIPRGTARKISKTLKIGSKEML